MFRKACCHNTVPSVKVAIAMATGACEKYGADYDLSATGFRPIRRQPGNSCGNHLPGYASPIGLWAKKLTLKGDRISNRRRAATAALD